MRRQAFPQSSLNATELPLEFSGVLITAGIAPGAAGVEVACHELQSSLQQPTVQDSAAYKEVTVCINRTESY